MGKTTSEVKDRYNKKNYDQIQIRVKKGDKEAIKHIAEVMGYTSLNKFIVDAIEKYSDEAAQHYDI